MTFLLKDDSKVIPVVLANMAWSLYDEHYENETKKNDFRLILHIKKQNNMIYINK